MLDDDTKDWFRPRAFEELAKDAVPVSLINEPVRDEVIELRPGQAAASLHALLVGLRNQAQALLGRMENRGVQVARDDQREVVGCSISRPEISCGRCKPC